MNGMGKEKNGLEKAKIIPCILKQDALERHLESDIKKALSAHVTIVKTMPVTLSRADVLAYKSWEWQHDTSMPVPKGLFLDCILAYEAAPVSVMMIAVPPEMDFEALRAMKGKSFLPARCDPSSIRGMFADKTQIQRLTVIDGTTYEKLPDKTLGFPRNMIHIPDSPQSAGRLTNIIRRYGRCSI